MPLKSQLPPVEPTTHVIKPILSPPSTEVPTEVSDEAVIDQTNGHQLVTTEHTLPPTVTSNSTTAPTQRLQLWESLRMWEHISDRIWADSCGIAAIGFGVFGGFLFYHGFTDGGTAMGVLAGAFITGRLGKRKNNDE